MTESSGQARSERGWRVFFTPRMLVCIITGFSAGLPLYLLFNLLPAWLENLRGQVRRARGDVGVQQGVGVVLRDGHGRHATHASRSRTAPPTRDARPAAGRPPPATLGS